MIKEHSGRAIYREIFTRGNLIEILIEINKKQWQFQSKDTTTVEQIVDENTISRKKMTSRLQRVYHAKSKSSHTVYVINAAPIAVYSIKKLSNEQARYYYEKSKIK